MIQRIVPLTALAFTSGWCLGGAINHEGKSLVISVIAFAIWFVAYLYDVGFFDVMEEISQWEEPS